MRKLLIDSIDVEVTTQSVCISVPEQHIIIYVDKQTIGIDQIGRVCHVGEPVS